MALMPVCTGSIHRLASYHVGRGALHRHRAVGDDRAFAVQWPAQRVNNAAHQGIAHRHLNNLPGGPHAVTLFHAGGVAENGRAHNVRFQVHGQPENIIAKIQQFVGTDALQALNAGDAVTHLQNSAHVNEGQVAAKLLNLPLDERY